MAEGWDFDCCQEAGALQHTEEQSNPDVQGSRHPELTIQLRSINCRRIRCASMHLHAHPKRHACELPPHVEPAQQTPY